MNRWLDKSLLLCFTYHFSYSEKSQTVCLLVAKRRQTIWIQMRPNKCGASSEILIVCHSDYISATFWMATIMFCKFWKKNKTKTKLCMQQVFMKRFGEMCLSARVKMWQTYKDTCNNTCMWNKLWETSWKYNVLKSIFANIT